MRKEADKDQGDIIRSNAILHSIAPGVQTRWTNGGSGFSVKMDGNPVPVVFSASWYPNPLLHRSSWKWAGDGIMITAPPNP